MALVFKPTGNLPVEEQERLRMLIINGANWRKKLSALRKLDNQDFYKMRATGSKKWLDRALAAHLINDPDFLLTKICKNPNEDIKVKEVAATKYINLLR
jgi:hypothetical protein